MPNFDGQYEVRIIYTTTPSGFPEMQHTLTFDVLPDETPSIGTPFSDILVGVRDGLGLNLSDVIDDFVAGMIGIYPSTANIVRAELWYIPEGTFAGTFVSVYDITEVGTAVTGSQIAQQTTLTFRSIGGGSGRLQFMECSVAGNNKEAYPYANTAIRAIADYVTAPANPIVARDNTFFFANINCSHGQNERLWRKRYRD